MLVLEALGSEVPGWTGLEDAGLRGYLRAGLGWAGLKDAGLGGVRLETRRRYQWLKRWVGARARLYKGW